jgi:hypothetical protein
MAPNKKSKAFGVGSASFFDLQAEIARQKEEFAKNKAAGTPIIGGQKPKKVCGPT